MKLKDKFVLFLSYKLNLKLFSKIEFKIKNQISSELILGNKPNFNAHFRFIMFNQNKLYTHKLTSARIIIYILNQRGLLRTLLYVSEAISVSETVFELSRWRLGNIIIKERKLVIWKLLSHLSYEYLDFKDYSNMELLTSVNYANKNLLGDYKNLKIFIIEKSFKHRNYLEYNLLDGYRKNTLDGFISWDSRILSKFLRRYGIDAITKNYLQKQYPIFFDEFISYIELDYHNHELSNFSLDYIYQTKGLDYFETLVNVEVWHQRFILAKNKIINFDATTFPTQKFVAGMWPYCFRDKRGSGVQKIKRPTGISINLTEAIFLIGRCDENWYHFLLDTAPRLMFFESIPLRVPIVIRDDLPSTTKEFLRKLTTRKLIEVKVNDTVKVGKIFVCPGRSTTFDSTPPKGLNWVEYSPLVLNIFRNRVIESLRIGSYSHPELRIKFERRSAVRNIINEPNINKILQEFSFKNLQLDEKFFQKQVAIFYNANIVAAPGGAVLANIIFMKPGTKVLVLRSLRPRYLQLWKDLSVSLDLNYFEVLGLPTYFGLSQNKIIHSNFYISPKKLRRILSKEIFSRI